MIPEALQAAGRTLLITDAEPTTNRSARINRALRVVRSYLSAEMLVWLDRLYDRVPYVLDANTDARPFFLLEHLGLLRHVERKSFWWLRRCDSKRHDHWVITRQGRWLIDVYNKHGRDYTHEQTNNKHYQEASYSN